MFLKNILKAMPKYNIIYTAPNHDLYLWTGNAFFTLEKKDQEVLHFSGPDFKEDDLAQAIADCKRAAKEKFPKDEERDVKAVEIKVAD